MVCTIVRMIAHLDTNTALVITHAVTLTALVAVTFIGIRRRK